MKTLLVFCDGTGMDGTLSDPSVEDNLNPQTPSDAATGLLSGLEEGSDKGGGNAQYATNVLHLARSVESLDTKGNRQIVFYQSGVGSEANFKGDPVYETSTLQALGTAVASKIRDAYVFIAQNFEEGDEICLFGFSRGAYTARKLSGLIDSIGLLTRHNLGLFFQIWRQLMDKQTPDIPSDTRRTNIKCVGVWDTVGSVYKQIDALNIVDTSLPKTVEVARHAISLQENRKKFLPTLWSVPEGGLQPNQDLKQVWFPGAHSDIGGGYERHELADISLYWMVGEIKSLINLDLKFLQSYAQAKPDPWGTSQPHNAYKETPAVIRPIVGHETRLESSQIERNSRFHSSIEVSPKELKSPAYMITMEDIVHKFGSGFQPEYEKLNEYEEDRKQNWEKGYTLPRGVESPGVVIFR